MKKIKSRIIGQRPIKWRTCDWWQNDELKDIPKASFEKLQNSITQLHFIDPFKVWEDSTGKVWILDGRTRKLGMMELEKNGFKIDDELEADFIDCKNEKEAAELVLIFNSVYSRITEEGLQDFLDINEIFQEEIADTVSLDNIDLAEIFNTKPVNEHKLNEVPQKQRNIYSKHGDLFILDNKHRLLCGNSTVEKHIENLMDGNVANLVFTSPPYNMNARLYENYSDNLSSADYVQFNLVCAKIVKRFLNGFLFWNLSYNIKSRWEFIEIYYRLVKELRYQFIDSIIWDKCSALPITSGTGLTRQYENILALANLDELDLEYIFVGSTKQKFFFNKRTSRYLTNYWKISSSHSQMDNHKAAFPVKLVTNALKLMTLENDKVLDIFMGTGTTLVAANELNRICYGMELDPAYVDVILRRYKQLYPESKIECINRKFDFNKLWNE